MDQSPFCSTVFLWALPQLHSESFLCHLTSCICVASMKIDSLGNFKPSKATNVMVLRLEAKLSVILEKYDHPSGRSTPLFVHPFFPLTNNSSDPPEMPQKSYKMQNRLVSPLGSGRSIPRDEELSCAGLSAGDRCQHFENSDHGKG